MKQGFALLLLMVVATGLCATELDYPAVYREAGLPEYPNAIVTGQGRDNSNLRDGITLTLFTEENGSSLRQYYEAEMANRGWLLEETVASAKMRAAGMLDQMPFGAVFSKDGLRYQIFTSPQESGLSVRINLLED